MNDKDPEPVNTDVSTSAVIRLIRSTARNGLKREAEADALKSIIETCDNILEE